MNYDIEDMERIIGNNFAIHFAKQYSINKSDIDTYYTLGEIIEKEKLDTEDKLAERTAELSYRLGINISLDMLMTGYKFYSYIKAGMIKSYKIKWEDYLKMLELTDISKINNNILYLQENENK